MAVGSRGTRHSPTAAVVVALSLAVLTAACGSGRPAAGPPGTTTTSAGSCAEFGSTGRSAGAPAVTRRPAVALLLNVQVQASWCADEVAFLFIGGTPGWSAGYQAGPLTEDPSGRPVQVGGSEHLVIRFGPAAGADLASDHPEAIYDGPTALRPAAPSGVAAVSRLGDSESRLSWAVGLGARRPFQVVVRGEQVVVRLPAAAPRATRCGSEDPAVSVGYPARWYAELSDRWACRYFDPAPFVIRPATDTFSWAVTVQRADVSAAAVVARMAPGGPLGTTVSSRATRVAGLPATVLDVTESGQAMFPAGYQYRMYVLDSGARALTIQSTPAPTGSHADRNRAAADRIALLLVRS